MAQEIKYINEIEGYSVRANLKTAILYKQIAGRDYAVDTMAEWGRVVKYLMAMELAVEQGEEVPDYDTDTEVILQLFYAMHMTAENKTFNKQEYYDFLESIEVGRLSSIIESVQSIIFETSSTKRKPMDKETVDTDEGKQQEEASHSTLS